MFFLDFCNWKLGVHIRDEWVLYITNYGIFPILNVTTIKRQRYYTFYIII